MPISKRLPTTPGTQLRNGHEAWPWGLFLALFGMFFLLRSLVTFPVENVDALIKYDAAARIVRGGDWSILLNNQHTLRWAEMLPQVLVTWLTGFRYEGLYLLPLAAFAGACALLLVAAWPYLGALERLLLGGLLFIEPLALTHTGQLLNPPFGVLFSVLGVLCLAGCTPAYKPRVALAALMFFFAYGAHVTYLAFAGGAWAWLALRGQWSRAGLLAALMLALLLLETLLFNFLSGWTLELGRLQALAGTSHVAKVSSGLYTAPAGVNLFDRWLLLPAFNLVLVAGFLGLALQGGWQRRKASSQASANGSWPPFLSCAMLAAACYALAVTFAVVDLKPIKLLLPPRHMYLEVFMPFAALATVFLLRRWLENWRTAQRVGLAVLGSVVMGALFVVMVQTKGPLGETLNNRTSAFAWRSNAQLSDYAGRFAEGRLLVSGPNRHALVLLARYQRPVRVRQHGENRLGAARLQADALCVSQLRRIPVVRNFKDCKGFRPHRARPTT